MDKKTVGAKQIAERAQRQKPEPAPETTGETGGDPTCPSRGNVPLCVSRAGNTVTKQARQTIRG